VTDATPTSPNGPVAAAVVSCGLGCFVLGALSIAADGSKSLAATLCFNKPAGPLSGVTTVTIAVWLIAWAALTSRWKRTTLVFGKVTAFAFVLLGLGLLLTFPPVGDLFLGR
jgi:hypothetical protein